MLLEELSSVIPNNVLGKLVGKFYAELAKEIRAELQKRDPDVFTTVTMNFDAEQFNMLFFMTWSGKDSTPPTMRQLSNNLLKQLKLKGLEINRDITREDESSWSFDFGMDFADRIHKASDFDTLADSASAAFKANIGDVDYQLHT